MVLHNAHHWSHLVVKALDFLSLKGNLQQIDWSTLLAGETAVIKIMFLCAV